MPPISRKATPAKKARARLLRASPAAGDAALWKLIRGKQVAGLRFRRRAIVEGWIPDFWCPSAKLAIEIDATADARKTSRDLVRDAALLKRGIRTLHFTLYEVETQPRYVRASIARAAKVQAAFGAHGA